MTPPMNRRSAKAKLRGGLAQAFAIHSQHKAFSGFVCEVRKPTEFELKPLRDSATLTSKLLSVVAERTVTVRSLSEDETLLQDLAIKHNGTGFATGACSR